MVGFARHVGSEEEHEAHDTCSVVQQGFRIYEGGETFTGFQLVQQGHDGYRVGGSDLGTEHEGECPGP